MERLFVYGSLLRALEHPMGRTLAGAASLQGEAFVRGRLYAVCWYPGLVLDDAAPDVRGELWRLDDLAVLARLDAYEGCGEGDPPPHEFRRVRAIARARAGEVLTTWAYVYARSVREADRVASGDWRGDLGRFTPSGRNGAA